MEKIKKVKTILVFSIIVALLFQTAAASQTINKDKSLTILSDVFGIDLSKYNVEFIGSSSTYTSAFGPNVKQESIGYTLSAGNSTIVADINFANDILWYCNLHITDKPILSQETSTNLNDQSKTTLQRYKTYESQNAKTDITYLLTALNALNALSAQNADSVQVDNINLNVTEYQTDTNLSVKTFKLSYTENGVNVNRKALTLTYTDGILTSISDTWNILSIGSLDSASKKEILGIAWAAAQNLMLEFTSENGSTYYVKPDLTDVTTEVSFDMQARPNSTTLYPAWLVTYYFAEPYNQDYGIQLGIWGDTKEVAYCHPLVILGDSTPSDSSNPSTKGIQIPESVLLVVFALGLIAIIAVLTIVIRARRKK
jgi:hypothetical protein